MSDPGPALAASRVGFVSTVRIGEVVGGEALTWATIVVNWGTSPTMMGRTIEVPLTDPRTLSPMDRVRITIEKVGDDE